jgi:hypothetical protein
LLSLPTRSAGRGSTGSRALCLYQGEFLLGKLLRRKLSQERREEPDDELADGVWPI